MSSVDVLLTHVTARLDALPAELSSEERRRGAQAEVLRSRDTLEQSVRSALAHAPSRIGVLIEPLVDLTSALFAAGVDLHTFRGLSSALAHAYTLSTEHHLAHVWAALAHDWERLSRLPASTPRGFAGRALHHLILPSQDVALEPNPNNPFEVAWAALVRADDSDARAAALETLAGWWLNEYEAEGWPVYAAWEHPCFEPEVCAAAALAARSGLTHKALSPGAAHFLDAGLQRDLGCP